MPDNMKIAGSLAGTNMYRDERAGHTLTRASKACRGYEKGLAKSAAIRDMCSFLRVHDPKLFDGEELAYDGHQGLLPKSSLDGKFKLKNPRRAPIPALIINQLEVLFSPVNASEVNLFFEADWASTKHRLYTVKEGSHSNTVRYRIIPTVERFSYGTVVGLYMFHVLNDIRSPTITFLEILPWQCSPGSTMLPVLRQPNSDDFPTIILRPCDVFPDTVLFLDAIPDDALGGATHNLVTLDPLPLLDLKDNPVFGL